jgi:uncharacterized protein (DUF4213/DUF364 family)
MAVIDKLIASIEEDHPVEEIIVGAYDVAVVSRNVGISSSFRKPCGFKKEKGGPNGVARSGCLHEMSALELAEYAKSDKLLEASVGIAALNSLLAMPASDSIVEKNAFDVIADRGEGKRLAVVGHFPFVKRLRDYEKLTIIQKQPWETEEALREAEERLPGHDVVAITASSLINHTFDRLLELSRGAFVIVLGPSAPVSPVMFELGVDVLCGAVVEDRELVLRCISQGATFKEVRGVRRATIYKA